ncbi:hypothetical protein ACHAO8_001933 [Botrytis cinerea]
MPPKGRKQDQRAEVMPPKNSRKQFQRGEEVMQVDDPKNQAFKAQPVTNSKKRSNTVRPSIENGPIEIDSDDEQFRPSKKSCSGPAAPKLNNRAAKQKEPLLEARQESEESDSLEVIACPNLPPKKLLQPFADEDADVYIVLIPKNPKYTFRMHSHILKRASPWFAKQFQEVSVVEMNKGTAAIVTRDTGIKYRFELRFDDHLGYHALKRVGLTMYKEQPQAVFNRAVSTNGYNHYSFSGNGSSNSLRSSLSLPQCDGSCDDIEMANTTGDHNASTGLDMVTLLPWPSKLSPTQDSVNEIQENENVIKSEEDTTTLLNSAELDLPAQNKTEEQVATPPTSPSKAEIVQNTDQTISHGPPVDTESQAPLADQRGSRADLDIKVEMGFKEQTFSLSLLEHKSPERQLEDLSNAGDKLNEQFRPVLQPDEMPPSRQVSPEEQLQDAISKENPVGPGTNPEEAQLAATSPLKQQFKAESIVETPSSNNIVTKTVDTTIEYANSNNSNQKPIDQQALLEKVGILDAYHSLFLCCYGWFPAISTADISAAMKQISTLVKVATLYHSLKIVRPHIVSSLFSHGRNLYSAIREDPPRFLILATKLQCALIFKEALIHIVGQYPSWPWPTKKSQMGPDLGKVVSMKFDDLQHMIFKVNGPLFQSCVVKDKLRVSINNLDRSNFDIWVIVQIWHDWFSQQLRHCTLVQHHEHRNVEKNMYRLISQGGDAYLKIDDVMAMIEPFRAGSEAREWGHWEKDQVEVQLRILKEYAAIRVKDLLENELMGETGGNAGEIEYLTCTKVGEHELPWVEAPFIIED